MLQNNTHSSLISIICSLHTYEVMYSYCRILQPSNYKSSGMGSKLSAMGVSGVGNRLVGGGMSGHRNSISFDRSGEYYKQLTRTGKIPLNHFMVLMQLFA